MSHWCRWVTLGAVLAVCAPLPLAAQPTPAEAEPEAIDVPLPHVLRMNGPGAVVQRDVDEADLQPGEHLAFGDRVTTGEAQVQLVWSDGTLVSVDRRATAAVLAPDLLALTIGRAILVTPRQADGPVRVDTPAGAVVVAAGSDVRVEVDGVQATVQVVHGTADVQQAAQSVALRAGQSLTLRDGLAPGAPQVFNTAAFDTFVEWAREPVTARERSASAAHLGDPRLEAYADVFDRHGQWQQDAAFGQVWFPNVGADWRPFSQGYWQPFGGAYGPTWVGLDPWGWPTHHYGGWDVNPGGRWFWRPGRQWSPGRVTWSVGPGYVGWSPRGMRGDGAWAWNRIVMPPRATQRGVYPAGTLDPFRAWTVIPTEHYGMRGGLSPYAVDARTLGNLNAFVTQRVAPPLRPGGFGGAFGGPGMMFPGSGGGFPGRATGRGGYGSWTGDDTTGDLRRGIPPTRVGPPAPGPLGGPGTGPADDPYERARGVMVPRTRPRTPPPADDPPSDTSRTGAPRRQPVEPPPAAAAPPAERTGPPSRGVSSPRRAPEGGTSRQAVPRPQPQ